MNSPESTVIPLPLRSSEDLFAAGRQRMVDFLLGYSLIESHLAFVRARKPYPFVERHCVLPGAALPKGEHRYQNTAFMILLDGVMPDSLIKHFRLRKSNRVTAANLRRMGSGITLDEIRAEALDLRSAECEGILRQLLPIDYALLAERPEPGRPLQLSHAHVKIERLTDIAVRQLALDLGYIERRLFERSEDYADALEAKFYEYYGFPANASGRKSAAAMAAQMLAGAGCRFSVLLANQDDCRITVLDDGPLVTQYMLLRLNRDELDRLLQTCRAAGIGDLSPFVLLRDGREAPIVLYRVDFARSAPARGTRRSDGDRLLRQPWLEIVDERILRVPAEFDEDGAGAASGIAALPFRYARPPP